MKTLVTIILTAFAICAAAQGIDAMRRVSTMEHYLLTVQSGKHIQVVKTADTLVVDSIAKQFVPCFSVTVALAATPFAEYRTKTHTLYIERKTGRKTKKYSNK